MDQQASYLNLFSNLLSRDEKEKAHNIQSQKERARFVIGRGLLRAILGHYVGIDPSNIQFCYGTNGKPMLVEPHSGIGFNLAHSNGEAIYAVTKCRAIGVDLEKLLPISQANKMVYRFFSTSEKIAFSSLRRCQRLRRFYENWTSKEAYLKACGKGLTVPLNRVEVSQDGQFVRLLNEFGEAAEVAKWSLIRFSPNTDLVAALVVEGSTSNLRCWRILDEISLIVARSTHQKQKSDLPSVAVIP